MSTEKTGKQEKPEAEMPVTNHPGGHKNDADPAADKKIRENKDITLQSQKGKKVDADPTEEADQPTKE